MITSEEIKQLRSILGLTQKELAEKLGTSIKTVANYESGSVIPSAKQKLLMEMLNGARNSISHNTGSINMGNVGGHNVTIADPTIKKIIDQEKIQIERDMSIDAYIQTIEGLKARISDLERVIEAKDALIKILQQHPTK